LSFKLKGQKARIGKSIRDGAYRAMMDAIRMDAIPNFLFLRYDPVSWSVKDLLLIPSFAFPASAIVECPPLKPTAKRAGWVGCNIALHRIPVDARIGIVTDSQILPAKEVRARFRRVKPLAELTWRERGWTLDVLNAVRRLGKSQFTTADMYSFTRELEGLHPDNRHVKDKIRQQLQVLRDRGLLRQVERGTWALT